MPDEPRLAIHRTRAIDGQKFINAIRLSRAGSAVVSQAFLENAIPQPPDDPRIQDRKQNLYAPVEVARHQIRAAHIHLFCAAVLEVIQAAVFKKPPDNADHPNVFADSWNSRTQAT